MGNLPPPLLRRSQLLPGESLLSLLSRLAWLNHYVFPSLLSRLCLDGQKDRPAHPHRPETYERIAALTKIDATTLYVATWHPFARVLVPPGVEVETVELPGGDATPLLAGKFAAKYLRPESAAQYCPACLREAAYHRTIWLPAAAAVCTRHECLLQIACPRCWKKVSIQAITLARCTYCKADLADAELIPLGGDDWGLFSQQVIQSWLAGEPSAISDPVHRVFPAQPPDVLYRVLDGLRWVVVSIAGQGGWRDPAPTAAKGESQVRYARPTPALAYHQYAAALKGLANWPEGFYDFLQAYASRGDRVPQCRLYDDLGTLYSCWLQRYWQHPAFHFVQDAFDHYAADHYAGSPSAAKSARYRSPDGMEKMPCVSLAEAAAMLGTTPKMIERLVEADRLSYYNSRRTPGFRYVWRDEVLALRERWRETVSLAEAAQRLGLGKRVVVDLVRAGLLVAERGPGSDGYARWCFSRGAVEGCADRIMERVTAGNLPPPSACLKLAVAVQVLSALGLNTTAVLGLVLEGRLPGYCLPGDAAVPGKTLLSRAEVRACLEVLRAERGWVEREEIARRMGVKHTVVSRWVRAGLLTPLQDAPGHSWRFSRAEVEQFVVGHIFTEEAARMLEVDEDTVRRWVKTGRLIPVAGLGSNCGTHRGLFRREDVERLLPERRLTAPQIADALGVSHAQVLRYVAQGKLVPVSGPGVDAAGHYLFIVPPGGLVVPGRSAVAKQAGMTPIQERKDGEDDGP